MEPYRLRVPGQIEKLVRGLHPELKRKVRAGLDLIRTDPAVGKELRGAMSWRGCGASGSDGSESSTASRRDG